MVSFAEHGLYKLKSSYFEDFKSPYWTDSKNGNRPYYYAINGGDGIIWLIPLSSQIENYKAKIAKEEAKRGKGNCIYYHTGLIAGKERVFLIGDMLPVTADYIDSAFIIGNSAYVVRNKNLNSELYSKSMRFLKLLRLGKIHSRTNVLKVEYDLTSRP